MLLNLWKFFFPDKRPEDGETMQFWEEKTNQELLEELHGPLWARDAYRIMVILLERLCKEKEE